MAHDSVLRANSRLRKYLGNGGVDFLYWAVGAVERILPHAEIEPWREIDWAPTESVWRAARTEIRITIAVGPAGVADTGSLQTIVRRRNVPVAAAKRRRVLDIREHDICRRIASRIAAVVDVFNHKEVDPSLKAIRDDFDERVIADHLREHHSFDVDLADVLSAFHELSEQTYENKPLTFGAVLDPKRMATDELPVFPRRLLESKRYKALSDGFKTAYHVSTNGHLLGFVDLERFDDEPISEKHFFPGWAEDIAKASRDKRCGICLSRQGDLLVFDNGTLRFTYRYGRWQYWNHSHLLNLLKNRSRAQKVSPATIGKVVTSIYRAALDVSFRRGGGLFVMLHNRRDLGEIVRSGDELGSSSKEDADKEFDHLIDGSTIQALPRPVVVELASLDGAFVVDNSGRVRAYGAVLRPKKKGLLKGTEGSRTQAAIGASNYGLAVKISSDGGIVVYHDGEEFLAV